ncbi:MAG: hypothetical protein B6241_12920 [Spirochaetaceae bacterium 4572_59]|nr:MAG: hypothetical protein B6241_12920 [Spirochaetaceae bacterium 4572_59]
MVVNQFDICLVNLDRVVSMEISQTRFCLILSPREMIDSLSTILIAPMSTSVQNGPSRLEVSVEGKKGYIVLDQIRTIQNRRIIRRLGHINDESINQLISILAEIFIL